MAKKLSAMEQLRNRVKNAVARATKATGEPVRAVKNTLSKRAQAVQAVLAVQGFGCHTKAVYALTSAVLGESIPVPVALGDVALPGILVAVVPVANTNSHNYPINIPMVVVQHVDGWAKGVRMDGTLGNSLSKVASEYRLATPKQVEDFFKAVPEAALTQYFSWVG